MTLYRVLKGVAFTKEDGSSAQAAVTGATIECDDEFAAPLVEAGRLEKFDGVFVEPKLGVGFKEGYETPELVDETPSGGKPNESSTNAELVDFLD
jgi:hypothetical protein